MVEEERPANTGMPGRLGFICPDGDKSTIFRNHDFIGYTGDESKTLYGHLVPILDVRTEIMVAWKNGEKRLTDQEASWAR